MREKDRERRRRRHRCEKRKKLRGKLLAATDDNTRRAVEARIRKTYPKYVTED